MTNAEIVDLAIDATYAQRLIMVCVDDSAHARAALRWATRRAKHTGAQLALLHVLPPPDFQHWGGVAEIMQQEAQESAEAVLRTLAGEACDQHDVVPLLYVKTGPIGDAILAIADEHPEISTLVLGMRSGDGGGKLVGFLTGHLAGRLQVPMTVVPGSLSPEEIDGLT